MIPKKRGSLTHHGTVNRSSLTRQGTMNYSYLTRQVTMNHSAYDCDLDQSEQQDCLGNTIHGSLTCQGTTGWTQKNLRLLQ